ncbi:uncharacterized protein LOC135054888 isoform X3 [Pseudophryne corroboree]|uniref:uncharacterized protein LOC135054888 isoform X3 n=1 Tax=Pseudophryne corroboree TaxID=495146 RepID=UPI00308192A9
MDSAGFMVEAMKDLGHLNARASSMAVSARRGLWLRQWSADTESKKSVENLPFTGQALFGEVLDAWISTATGDSRSPLTLTLYVDQRGESALYLPCAQSHGPCCCQRMEGEAHGHSSRSSCQRRTIFSQDCETEENSITGDSGENPITPTSVLHSADPSSDPSKHEDCCRGALTIACDCFPCFPLILSSSLACCGCWSSSRLIKVSSKRRIIQPSCI